MKIKINHEKETITIKGLTALEFSVIEVFMNHTRLGQVPYDGGASDAAFAFNEAVEEAAEELSYFDMPEVMLVAVPSEEMDGVTLSIEYPTLEVYVD